MTTALWIKMPSLQKKIIDQFNLQVCSCLQEWVYLQALVLQGTQGTPPTPTTRLHSPPSNNTTSMSAKLHSDRALTCRGDYPHNHFDHFYQLLAFRMVESQQRLESMRAAEARANSFLNPYSKGDNANDDVNDDFGDCHADIDDADD